MGICQGPMAALSGGNVTHERGTPVVPLATEDFFAQVEDFSLSLYLGRQVFDEVFVEAEGGEGRACPDGGGEREEAVVVQDQLPQRVEPPDLHAHPCVTCGSRGSTRGSNRTRQPSDVSTAVGHTEQLLYSNVLRFRGGLVFKAHRLLYHSTLGLRVIRPIQGYLTHKKPLPLRTLQ